jgi:hypothetical protein
MAWLNKIHSSRRAGGPKPSLLIKFVHAGSMSSPPTAV